MIHRLQSMIGTQDTLTITLDGRWVLAVPEPFRGSLFDRLRDAWEVLAERAVAVRWPAAGELEDALSPPKPRVQPVRQATSA